ncbi:deoxyribose-phosphate aldolase [Actinotalea sp. M2MS4P-6]|uniref:deoxyribose-phosphate aldolase n=1 Tax=Actinotalea sp. M2MS4P-6 TaxID=2983762 RepID=UPI0021E40728|nr:deoxyribose-phosphate aldolase [Actinotalea sp. M2MS4P-6]MCV2395651.1 deoxyribose-phosphate aldolase [Actinotalea sp. M2MS4P-6]
MAMVDLAAVDAWELGKAFDHSVLPKDTTEEKIRQGCREAKAYNCAAFYSSSPYWTPVVCEELAGTDVRPAAAVAFPFGSATAAMKARETDEAVALGCTAVDVVMNIGALKSGRTSDVAAELRDFKDAAGGALTKVILETAFLSPDEIATGCKLIADAGIDYAKTSSGQFEGPSMEHLLLMKATLEGTPVKLKVAGVKFPRPQNAYAFLLAGADLIGTRAVPEIIDALQSMRAIGLVPARR